MPVKSYPTRFLTFDAPPRKPVCFCGSNEWSGNGQYVTVTYRTRARAVNGDWKDSRQVSGYLERCATCGDRAVTDEDGEPLRFIRESDTIQEAGAYPLGKGRPNVFREVA